MTNTAPKRQPCVYKKPTGFRCPETSRRGVKLRNTGRAKGWENVVKSGERVFKGMQRHENFLSSRQKVGALLLDTV